MTNPKILDNVRLIQKCLIIRSDGKILALKRSADDYSRGGNWDLPGGGYERGEQVIEAIRREVKEEAGLIANTLHPIFVDNHMNVKKGFFAGLNVFGICYVCKDWEGEVILSDEHTEYQWVTAEEFAQLSFGDDNNFFSNSINTYTTLFS
jgi:8-oxo-dGTP diphosphatase